jgi:hypothetical protein
MGGSGGSGVTVDADNQVWAAGSGLIMKFSNAGVALGSVPVIGNPYGVAIASDDRIFSAGNFAAATVDPGPVSGMPGAVHLTMDINYPGIFDPFAYTYSDMTGFIARNITAPQGTWVITQDSGAAATIWTKVAWNGEPQGAVPAGTVIKVEVRAADTTAALGGLAFTEVTSGADLNGSGLVGRYIEVKATLRNNTPQVTQTPVLSDITVTGRSPNQPPVALCANRSVCTTPGQCQGDADINNGSSDPDGDTLTLTYSPVSPYSLGATAVSLKVDDGKESAMCSATVTVNDCEKPIVTCPPPQTLECVAGGASATLVASATDNCGSVSATCTPGSGSFVLGTTNVACNASDGAGNSGSCATTVTVVDTTPPVLAGGNAGALWPPNHKYQTLSLSNCGITVTDACTGVISLPAAGAEITCVSSDEPENAGGDGNTNQDIVIVDATTVQVRAEREGPLDGRVYRIGFTVKDAAGNTQTGTCLATVPHDQSGPPAVDSGPAYTVCRN